MNVTHIEKPTPEAVDQFCLSRCPALQKGKDEEANRITYHCAMDGSELDRESAKGRRGDTNPCAASKLCKTYGWINELRGGNMTLRRLKDSKKFVGKEEKKKPKWADEVMYRWSHLPWCDTDRLDCPAKLEGRNPKKAEGWDISKCKSCEGCVTNTKPNAEDKD